MSRALGTALVATLAIATMVWSMISATWGKRPVYLAGTLIMLVGCIVSGEGSSRSLLTLSNAKYISDWTAKTYNVLLGETEEGSYFSRLTTVDSSGPGGRILQGIGQSVLEFLVGSSLAEIYFLHERGVPVA